MANASSGRAPDLTLSAPAKINVGLLIGESRPDGYHEIWTILQEIRLCDEIRLWECSETGFSLSCDHPNVPTDDSNLCLKAAKLLSQELGIQRGLQIELSKRIPIGAGLGGGSSDAAATLKGLNQLWNLHLTNAQLLELAGCLGSDVPFFILGGCCIATGRGEILQPIESVVRDPMVLICPNVQISTTWAYKNIQNYSLTSKEKNIILINSSKIELDKPDTRGVICNDFEPLVFLARPELELIKLALQEAGAYFASLSGSGAALFGLFRSFVEAQNAAARISKNHGVVAMVL